MIGAFAKKVVCSAINPQSIMKNTLSFFLLIVFIGACSESDNSIPKYEEAFCTSIHRNDSISLSSELEDLADSMQVKTGVIVLEDGGNAMITRAWLTEYAEKSIDIQYFIFSTDNVGLIACDYLVRAADRGVKVRIIVDDIMVETDIQDILTMDSHENISIKIYNPGVNLGKSIYEKVKKFTTDFRSANQRMHNKTFIVDNKIVITGGRNIADEYFDYDHEYNFRDRDVLLLGKVSQRVNQSFEQFWTSELSVDVSDISDVVPTNVSEPDRFDRLHEYACNPENFWPQVREKIEHLPAVFHDLKKSGAIVWTEDVAFISDDPGKNDGSEGLGGGGKTTDALINLIKEAKESIIIQSPYLITTELSQDLFKAAVERGVTIKILTNSLASTDNLEAFSSYQGDREDLLNCGVQIFECKPDAAIRKERMTGDLQKSIDYTPIFGLHAKSMVIDQEICVIGTFNLDPRSANLNTECISIIHSASISEGVLHGMNEEMLAENAWEISLDFNPDSEVATSKRVKTWTRKILPKDIL
jgi:phosphatidylserine/phosphatidylglycerophosphate/cardiolipin synthase-like enzyme